MQIKTGLLGLLLAAVAGGVAQEKLAPEYRLKAGFLANFSSADFILWPSSAFPAPDAPFVVGVLGEDPFRSDRDELAEAFKGREPQGRKVRLIRSLRVEDLKDCHLVFVAGKAESLAGEVRRSLGGRPVLLVGEAPGFAAGGGGLNLDFDAGRPHFELNPEALKRAGLSPSARLLKVAPKLVKDGS